MDQDFSQSENSITQYFNDLRKGDSNAAQVIWQRYVDDLVRLAHKKLNHASRKVMDEEDVVQRAFENFFRQIQAGHFPKLDDRDDLWQILCMLVDRRAKDQIASLNTKKSGGNRVHGDSMNADASGSPIIEQVGIEASAEQAIILAESLQERIEKLPSKEHKQVALCKLENKTNTEIKDELGMSLRSVERRLKQIRELWSLGAIDE